MNFIETAHKILKKEKRPLSPKEITQIALKEGLITSNEDKFLHDLHAKKYCNNCCEKYREELA